MPGARHWAAGSRAWKFPFPVKREFHSSCNRCAHLSWQYAPSPAACIRTGFRDRNTCTACRNATRIRTWDKGPLAESPAAPCRTARSARRRGCRAYSPALAPCCSRVLPAVPGLAFLQKILCAAFLRDHGPDIHADGICLPQNLRLRWRIVSPVVPQDKSEGVSFWASLSLRCPVLATMGA